MKRLVSVALYDPDGMVAPFARRTIDALAGPGTTLVATATHPLTPEAAGWVRERGQLIERENVGLDMLGHQLVLGEHPAHEFDEVILTNDTFVLLRPLARIEDRIDPAAAFWGITASREIAPHVQSYFLCFRGAVTRDPLFAEHWPAVKLADRRQTIVDNEIGLSRTLTRAGHRFDVAFHPNAAELTRAQLRGWRHGRHNPRAVVGQWNPTMVLADAALNGHLPVVKISALRFDPFQLGTPALLSELERRFPEPMEGVRAYLKRTARAYG